MLVSEIMGARRIQRPVRRVGVEFSEAEQHRVMASAVDLYLHLGVDVEVEGRRISVSCGEAISGPLMALLERRTGRPGFNEWWAAARATPPS